MPERLTQPGALIIIAVPEALENTMDEIRSDIKTILVRLRTTPVAGATKP